MLPLPFAAKIQKLVYYVNDKKINKCITERKLKMRGNKEWQETALEFMPLIKVGIVYVSYKIRIFYIGSGYWFDFIMKINISSSCEEHSILH